MQEQIYPGSFADYFKDNNLPPWKAVWWYLSEHIQDDENNHNNRFVVASDINRQYFGKAAPFWGCPASQATEYLSTKKPIDTNADLFPEFRLAEQGNSTHSVWKLFYTGSVGGQMLLGLPYLYQLITDSSLANVSKVWPFDTGLKALTDQDLKGCNILHAEIYPSSIPVQPEPGEVKDRAQVRQLTHRFADLDRRGELSSLFAGRGTLSKAERKFVETKEGWILGVT